MEEYFCEIVCGANLVCVCVCVGLFTGENVGQIASLEAKRWVDGFSGRWGGCSFGLFVF